MRDLRPDDYLDAYETFEDEAKALAPGRVRTGLRKVLQNTDIKIGELQKILGVNANSYNKFMNGKYKESWSACQNGTYIAGSFFLWREKQMGKESVGKTHAKAKAAGGAAGGAAGATAAKSALPTADMLAAVELESDHVWLTPGEVRKELNIVMKNHGTTVAALARLVEKDLTAANVRNFLKAGGEFGGQKQVAYEPLAHLAERLRILLGKPKSKKRKTLEAEVAAGLPRPKLGLDPKGKYLTPPGWRMVKDALGRFGWM